MKQCFRRGPSPLTHMLRRKHRESLQAPRASSFETVEEGIRNMKKNTRSIFSIGLFRCYNLSRGTTLLIHILFGVALPSVTFELAGKRFFSLSFSFLLLSTFLLPGHVRYVRIEWVCPGSRRLPTVQPARVSPSPSASSSRAHVVLRD